MIMERIFCVTVIINYICIKQVPNSITKSQISIRVVPWLILQTITLFTMNDFIIYTKIDSFPSMPKWLILIQTQLLELNR